MIPLDNLNTNLSSTLLTIDFRVAVYQLLHSPEEPDSRWRAFFYSMRDISENLLIVDDRKDSTGNYWRQHWIDSRQQGFSYKGGRKEKPENYDLWYNTGLAVAAEFSIPVLASPGLEADDWAGAIYRNCTNITFVTIDQDWAQLVNDDKTIKMLCTGNWRKHSSLKDEAEVLSYYLEKDIVIASPRDIVELKMIDGDSGDNLARGSSRELIDLVENPMVPYIDHAFYRFAETCDILDKYTTNGEKQCRSF
jgi:5'-3' exonuclease